MFIQVGTATDVASGEMRAFDVAGVQVTVANVNGQFHALDDTCTHQGCSLASGELEGITVTCPCHGSRFDVTTGQVLRGPAERPERSRSVSVEDDRLSVEA